MSVSKLYITPDQLRTDSFKLGAQVLKDGFQPDFMVALWRGGAPIGCCIHELLKWKGLNVDHIAIRTSKYVGIDKTTADGEVQVHSTSYLTEKLVPGSKVLLVDDVWDSGTTIIALFKKIRDSITFPPEQLDIRVATIYYKPKRNHTSTAPHYYVYETDRWLVFPHELEGMDEEEVGAVFGAEILDIITK